VFRRQVTTHDEPVRGPLGGNSGALRLLVDRLDELGDLGPVLQIRVWVPIHEAETDFPPQPCPALRVPW